jgi:hypothetical protein
VGLLFDGHGTCARPILRRAGHQPGMTRRGSYRPGAVYAFVALFGDPRDIRC